VAPKCRSSYILVEEVWPLIKKKIPSAKLWIVGNAPTKKIFEYQKKDSTITVTGGIPDIRDAFNGAHALLAPVFSGKGTRYKILEAMASETPIVASKIAVEGLGLESGKHVLTSNSASEMATSAIKILENPDLRKKLANNGKKFVQEKYDWDQISKKLDIIYQQLGKRKAK
jgi:polysaccharide biosynthesis protein PslH